MKSKLVLFFLLSIYLVFDCFSQKIDSVDIGTLVFVPEGIFQRDQDTNNTSLVKKFYIGQFEITRKQYVNVTGLPDPSDLNPTTSENDPVQNISWYQSIVFCNLLSLKEGLIPVYKIRESVDPTLWDGIADETIDVPTTYDTVWDDVFVDWSASGYRLPTEQEWMWAAIGGKDSKNGYQKEFSGSTGKNKISNYAWIKSNSTDTTHPVGQKIPNELGIYDMSGNVMEWCWDWLGDYPSGKIYSDQKNGRGSLSGKYRVQRGGAWGTDLFSSVSYRCSGSPFYQGSECGFRIVRTIN